MIINNGPTQVTKLFDHMVNVKSISPIEAEMLYGVRSFHRRMADLRQRLGLRFRKERKLANNGSSYVRYYFEGVSA